MTVERERIRRLIDEVLRETTTSTSPFDRELARMIDHTLLKPEATIAEVEQLCREALQFAFASVCVNPCHVKLCSDLLRGSDVKVCTVISFPLGASTTPVKVYEAERAIQDGAQEIDMVINIGALKSGKEKFVEEDIRAVVGTAKSRGVLTKVILETSLLTDDEKVRASLLARSAGADFVKTSTGFGKGGATAADVALLRRTVGPLIGVKASGGIRTREQARAMIASGATRIGASASVQIVAAELDPTPSTSR